MNEFDNIQLSKEEIRKLVYGDDQPEEYIDYDELTKNIPKEK